MTQKLVLFDVDGTLMDSIAIICEAMDACFNAAGMTPPSHAQTRRIVGLNLDVAMRRLAPDADEATIRALDAAYRDVFVQRRRTGGGEAEAPLFPGARAALDRLLAQGYLLGVATGKARRGLDHMIATHDLAGLFCTLQTPDVAPSKPHPQMILNAAAEAGVRVQDIAMIGDTTYDIEMAVNAGSKSIGVRWGYHEPEELTAVGAQPLIGDYSEIDAALKGLWGAA